MVKIIGTINNKNNNRSHLYSVKRKNRSNSLEAPILSEYGRGQLKSVQKTCDLLNSSAENMHPYSKKTGQTKKYYYYPSYSSLK